MRSDNNRNSKPPKSSSNSHCFLGHRTPRDSYCTHTVVDVVGNLSIITTQVSFRKYRCNLDCSTCNVRVRHARPYIDNTSCIEITTSTLIDRFSILVLHDARRHCRATRSHYDESSFRKLFSHIMYILATARIIGTAYVCNNTRDLAEDNWLTYFSNLSILNSTSTGSHHVGFICTVLFSSYNHPAMKVVFIGTS